MNPKILLVDDEPNVTQALSKSLRHEEYEILCASSAKEALEVLAREPIAVIVTDEQMPGMSGSELLATICREYPETMRIILTGHASLKAAIRAINEGDVYRFMEKPCPAEELVAVIRLALQQRLDPVETVQRNTSDEAVTVDIPADPSFPGDKTDTKAKSQSIFFDWTAQEPVTGPRNQE